MRSDPGCAPTGARWLRAALLLFALLPHAGAASAQPALVFVPLLVHIAQQDGAPVATDAFVSEQVEHANELFRPLGLELVPRIGAALGPQHAELVTRADRDRLARFVRRGAVHCFLVAKLMDVDEPGRERRGVHWRSRGASKRHFVVVSRISGPYVLAHELGHFFGNAAHSPTAGNLMSYERGEGPPFLDAEQVARIKETLTRMLRSRELLAVARKER